MISCNKLNLETNCMICLVVCRWVCGCIYMIYYTTSFCFLCLSVFILTLTNNWICSLLFVFINFEILIIDVNFVRQNNDNGINFIISF